MSSFSLKPADNVKNRYTVLNPIARGGMGETFLAEDRETGNNVVLKVLPFSSVKDWKELELFEREIKVLKNLDHPAIPNYIDHFRYDVNNTTLFILVQEYVKGKNLNELVKSGRRFALSEVETIITELLGILYYIHHLQPAVIHRDINPNNIILDDAGKVYLVDFGAVGQVTGSTLAGSGTFVGTLGYMPQEQLYGKSLPASDIYGAGMSVIYLLTGKNPSDFDFDGVRVNYHDFVNIPERLRLLLDKMTLPDYKNRLSDAKKGLDYLNGKGDLNEKKIDFERRKYIKVKEMDDHTQKVIIKPLVSMHVVLFIFAVFWNSLVIGLSFSWMKGVNSFFLLAFIPFYAAGLFILFYSLFGFFGSTAILLNSDRLVYYRKFLGIIIWHQKMKYQDFQYIEMEYEENNKGERQYFLRILGSKNEFKIHNYSTRNEKDVLFLNKIISEHVSERLLQR